MSMFKQCTFAAILAVALSACGSSGNSNKAANIGAATQPPASQAGGQDSATNPSNPNSGSEGASNSGNSGAAGNGGTAAPATPDAPITYGGSVFSTVNGENKLLQPSNSKNLVLGGKTIVLNQRQEGIDWKGGTKLQYSEFGIYSDFTQGDGGHDESDISYAYGQITPAEKLPKGSAQYTGTGFYFSETKGLVPVQSSFNVNFDNKTLNGKLEAAAKAVNVPLSARIEGSSFQNTDGGVSVKGNFFGPKGEELGGTMFDANNQSAASFGAKKQ